ncbi:DUF3306 domain-containing protein [Thalassobius sp. MITS945101]|uniref:DUF3306 domain-containing protein n=1 Tax=Thalassobius sp. MITS945101 TaxID=3096994 RepID=UPI00399BAE3B
MSGGDFWSRRRAAVAAEAEAEVKATEAAVHAEEQAKLEELSDEELLEQLDLPDPDTMQAGDDFAAFMKKAVPERLRRRALRRLWTSNPVLANVDMLVDYGEDFTDSALVVENLQTAYQVGKGMKAHVDELARQARELEGLGEEAEVAAATDTTTEAEEVPQDDLGHPATDEQETETSLSAVRPPETPVDTVAAFENQAPQTLTAQDPTAATAPERPQVETLSDPVQPARRRMRFQFET